MASTGHDKELSNISRERIACLKQEGGLRDDANGGAQARQADVSDVHAVDQDLAALSLCQPQQRPHHAALSRACTP